MQKQQFEVEVLVNGKPLKEYAHGGRAYVEGRKGTSFSLRLRNSSWKRKLFIPSIDGLSVMNGEECGFDSSGYIVRPYSAITVDGWRTSDTDVAQFFFSSPDESYRKRMERGNNLGVIGVAVFDEKERPQPIVVERIVHQPHYCHDSWCWVCQRYHCPSGWHAGQCNGTITFSVTNATSDVGFGTTATGSNSVMALNSSSNFTDTSQVMNVSQDIGTGWGESRRSEVTSVEFEREGSPAALFEIFYNTREQLERAGVDLSREPLQVAPQAFPGRYCEPPKR